MASPAWLDQQEYPFAWRTFQVPAGRMHYIDEGNGRPIVFVHGTPTWSFLYRRLIRELSHDYRCIAADQIGFGMSDKPAGWTYRLEDHARNLALLLDYLDLRDCTLVVHDLGGPIGLSYAIERPERIRDLVIFNTTFWSFADDPRAARVGRLFAGKLGKILYTRFNFSPRVIMPAAFGDRRALTPEIHGQYLAPFATPADRYSAWRMACEVVDAGPWLNALWERRNVIAEKPTALIWGLKDPAFGRGYLARFQSFLTNARTITLPSVGHFVPEEAGEQLLPNLRTHLKAGAAREVVA